eukprot:1524916-Pyramimonas_sp.AAC.1
MLPRLQGPARYPALSDPHVEPSGHNSGLIAIAIGTGAQIIIQPLPSNISGRARLITRRIKGRNMTA